MRIRKTIFPLLCVLMVTPAWSRVFLRWEQATVPPAKTLGVYDLVIPWDAGPMPWLEEVRKQGYRVYTEVNLQRVSPAAEAGARSGLAGIVLEVAHAEQAQADETLRNLRSAYPKLTFLVLNPEGKQPEMRGQLVVKRDGILEATSPTAQPWLDTNLALVRFEQTFHPAQVPLYSFQWDLSDPLQQQLGPSAEDYSLAVAEASALHADLILNLSTNLQKALARNDAAGWSVWNQVKRYVEFGSRGSSRPLVPLANVGVVTDDYETSYEAINLLARQNIPVRVLRPAELQTHWPQGLDVIVVFAAPEKQAIGSIADFAAQGGVAILVDLHDSYPWQSDQPARTGEHSVVYEVGKGRVIELSKPLTDPEPFAQDVRRLMDKQKVLISLWNALTTVAVPYRDPDTGETVLELVNYAQEPLRIQVQVKGSFPSIRYETPEHGCCQSLAPIQRGGFMEFVVPGLRIGGRVHRGAAGGSAHPAAVH
jgi:hypothetical protein